MSEKYKHSDLTNIIIAAFYNVYNRLGYGFQEKIYANSLAIEIKKHKLEVIREAKIDVFYDGQIVGEYFADLVIDNKIIIETKVTRKLIEEHEAQLLNYLKATTFEIGLLLNFGPDPEIKRKIYDNTRKGTLSWVKS